MNQPRVLIIQTTPYSTNSSSRSLDSYFHFWEKDRVRQVFSRNWKPQKGHCSELFQITDSDLLKCWFHRKKNIGNIYEYENLEEQGSSTILEESNLISRSYKLGRSHTPTIELLRGLLWRKKYWCSKRLIQWLDDYKPELVFYNFTNNLFLPRIALFVAERYDIPIITAIGDDYYFNERKSISPAYHLFRSKYKKLTKRVFQHKGSAVYVCDKIRDKYNEEFGLKGDTVYFNSTVKRKPFSTINLSKPTIAYFGNIRLGRSIALKSIADALRNIDPNYRINIYTNETDESVYHNLGIHPNVVWNGAVPYSEVISKMQECDIYVIAEGCRKEDINFTKYSLSTKAADGLASGCAVYAYGPTESGVIDYLTKTNAVMVCSDDKELESSLRTLLGDIEMQRQMYLTSEMIAKENHTIEGSTKKFERIIYELFGSNVVDNSYMNGGVE